MRSFGHLNMQQNELQEVVMQIEENFPMEPIPGRLVFKNRILYVCVEITAGTPVWIPLTNQINSYTHHQSSNSATWTIVHNLNSTIPVVQIYDSDNKVIMPSDIQIISNTQLNVNFGVPVMGRAVVMTSDEEGNPRPSIAFEHTQTTPSTTWIVDHNLGYYPIVRVFIGNQEVQPLSITHDSVFRTTISFSEPQVGIARFI